MNVLALDTSTLQAALAVIREGRRFLGSTGPGTRHGRGLLPAIRDLLREADLALADLDGLAVGLGPGSYTGLRVGLMAAKTLAYAAGKPLVGLDSLEVIARQAPAEALRVSVIGDAQRGDLYVADFVREQPGGPLIRVRPTGIEAELQWRENLAPGTMILGPGLGRLTSSLPDQVSTLDDPERNRPGGAGLAELARDVWESGRRDDPWFLEPVYLRRSAAEDKFEGKAP